MLTGPCTDPAQLADLKRVFDVLRCRVTGAVAKDDDAVTEAHGLMAMNGGRNNPIFACTAGGQALCVKLHRTDGRQRDRREWEALGVLAAQSPEVAPFPVAYEPGRQPVMAIERLPGWGLGEFHLTADQVSALADANRALHAVTARRHPDLNLLPARLTDDTMLTQVSNFFDVEADIGTPLREELRGRWGLWASGTDPKTLVEPAPAVLGQGDPNLTNCQWDGEQLRLIDWEYAGWSNQAYELALLVEHVQSRHTPDTVWQSLLEQSGLTPWGHRRTIAARRLVAWFWVKTFWPNGDADDERFTAQACRALDILSESGWATL